MMWAWIGVGVLATLAAEAVAFCAVIAAVLRKDNGGQDDNYKDNGGQDDNYDVVFLHSVTGM